jgi:hypothetical protein
VPVFAPVILHLFDFYYTAGSVFQPLKIKASQVLNPPVSDMYKIFVNILKD